MAQSTYYCRWSSQTLTDTKAYWARGVFLIIGSGIIGLLFQYQWLGREFALSQARAWIIGTLVPAVVMGLVFLLWNAIRAPAKLAAIDAQELDKERGVRQELEARREQQQRRREIGEAVGWLWSEGTELRNQCTNEREPPPVGEFNDWVARTEEYLAAHLDASYIARFRDSAGLSAPPTKIQSRAHVALWASIWTRLARLEQFIQELTD